jgi:hypothetical protein
MIEMPFNSDDEPMMDNFEYGYPQDDYDFEQGVGTIA